MCVMTPLRMASISGAWTAESEDGASVRFRKPIFVRSATTWLMIWSPLRKW